MVKFIHLFFVFFVLKYQRFKIILMNHPVLYTFYNLLQFTVAHFHRAVFLPFSLYQAIESFNFFLLLSQISKQDCMLEEKIENGKKYSKSKCEKYRYKNRTLTLIAEI